MNVSLFTVTHNDSRTYLPRLIESVDRFVPKDSYLEHIIWDNASGQEHKDYLLSLQSDKRRIIFSSVNLHDLPAYNEGLRLVKTPYVLCLNSHTRVIGPVNLDNLVKIWEAIHQPAIMGPPGPVVRYEQATPHGVPGWGWIARLLVERDLLRPGEDTAHIQTWSFFLDVATFYWLGGFEVREQRFDMRWPDKRFPERPWSGDKGGLIAAEIFFSVNARRKGFRIVVAKHWPFYHYPSGKTAAELEEIDRRFGFE